jgi:hypothetical protein
MPKRKADGVVSWLLDGDPAIRWQTMRDIQGTPSRCWEAERRRTAHTGWGARLLALQAPDGSWGGGIYTPKWISTTYTLLMLMDIGIPHTHAAARKAAELVLERQLGRVDDPHLISNLADTDRCIVGMTLSIAVYFGIRDKRVSAMVNNLLSERMPDGAWNCRRRREVEPHHSSLHTTFNVLEGLQAWLAAMPQHPMRENVLRAETSALEFVLQHRLFKSDKTGRIIKSTFTMLSYPHRWYYNVLRGLEYFARMRAPLDERMQEAVELLEKRRRADGSWPVQHRYPGKVFFEMEKIGRPSRWNTLRALRVLKWWQNSQQLPSRESPPQTP